MVKCHGLATSFLAFVLGISGPGAPVTVVAEDDDLPAAVRNAAVEHVKCQVCELMVVEARSYINETKAKDYEDKVSDTIENMCMTSRKAGRWILTYDLSRIPEMPVSEMLDGLWQRYAEGKDFLVKEDVHRLLKETDPRNPTEMLTDEQWRNDVCEQRFKGSDPDVGISKEIFATVYQADGDNVIIDDYQTVFGSQGGQLRLFKQPDFGHCNRECKVVQKACKVLHRRVEDPLRDGLLQDLTTKELQDSLCTTACQIKAQDLPELSPWENEIFKPDKMVVANDVMKMAQKKSRKMGYSAHAVGGGSALNPDIDDDDEL